MDAFGWVGSVIDDQFVIEAVAGEGAFGIVYRGRHLGFDAPIAIKCLKIPADLEGMEREKFLTRFGYEAKILYRISRHTPSVVQAIHVGAATSPKGAWTPYLVMEWLEGRTLADDLQARRDAGLGPRSIEDTMALLTPAATALTVAHAEHISHRDIKPANLFLKQTRNGERLTVVDFGIAKMFSESPSITEALAKTGKTLNAFTPRYGAPEQFSQRYGATGPWTDVYAMALIFIEVATGRPALRGSDVIQLFVASSDEQRRPSLRANGVEANSAIEDVLACALAISPALRYRNMDEMWKALEEAQQTPSQAKELPPARATASSSETIESKNATTGEHRICTVMFIDFSEITSPSVRVDPETLSDTARRCFAEAAARIEAMGGIWQNAVGDRAMAIFGYPRATDNDAERTALAALELEDMVESLPIPRAVRAAKPKLRASIATGRVFVDGGFGTSDKAFAVVGDAVGTAAGLLQAAPRGEIVLARDTYRLIASLFHAVPIDVTAQDPPIRAYRLMGRAPLRSTLASPLFCGLETKFVGRGAEQQRLIDFLETSFSENRAIMVTLIGPPGVGRSRMLAELSSALTQRSEPCKLLAGQASPLAASSSYGLFASMLRRQFESEQYPTELHETLTDLGAIFGDSASPDGRFSGLAVDDAGSLAKLRIAAAIARLLDWLAAQMPVVMLCDDLQWADDASLDLLNELTLRLSDRPVFIVAATRPELYERRPQWGDGRAEHARVELGVLPRRHIEEMIRDRLRHADELSAELIRVLVERAEGSPLILEETLHLLVDAGIIEPRSGAPWQVHDDRLPTLVLPATVQGIVQARLDRLESEARTLLCLAAVIGKTFWESAIERLCETQAGGAAKIPVDKLLATLKARQLIRVREPSTILGEREYTFVETSTREVAYEMLSQRIRRPLHIRIAEWIESRMPGGQADALLAYHYSQGGDPRRAAAAHAKAATYATSLGENGEALRHLSAAAGIHDEPRGTDADHDQDDRRVAAWPDRVHLRLDWADALRRAGRLDEASQACEDALKLIVHKERRRGAAQLGHAPMVWEARSYYRLALVERVRGATNKARELVERAISQAEEAHAMEEVPGMYAILTFLHRRAKNLEAAALAARRGLRVCRSLRQQGARYREDVAQLLMGLAVTQYSHGRMVRAERLYRQAFRAVDERSNPYLAGMALNGVAASLFYRGENKAARDNFLRSLRVKEKAGDLHQIAIAHNNLAEVSLKLGDTSAALEHARRSVRIGEQVRAGYDLSDMYKNLAMVSLAAGDFDTAIDAGRKALGIAEVSGRVYLGEIVLTLARICAEIGERTAKDAPAHGRARDVALELLSFLDRESDASDLQGKADACRSMLVSFLDESAARPSKTPGR